MAQVDGDGVPLNKKCARCSKDVEQPCAGGCENCSMAFTPLHRELGLRPSELTIDIIVSAVREGITEQSDLDWKLKLPDPRDQGAKDEFAKDVTSMVNSGGGTIVFGVRENSATSAAEGIEDVGAWTDAEERRLRAIVYAAVQPPVQNLEFLAVQDDSATIVVLSVPASTDTPHFQVRQGSLRAPRRYGAQTVDMSERDIEQAYRARFEGRRARESTLTDLDEDIVLGLPQADRVWMSAVAVPLHPRPAHLGRLSREAAQEIFDDLRRSNSFLSDRSENSFVFLNVNPRSGFRKWRALKSTGMDGPTGAAEVHDDGSVALAWTVVGAPDIEAGKDVHVLMAHQFPAYAVRLVQAATDRLGLSGGHQLRLSMHGDTVGPLYIRTYDHGFIRNREDLTPIHRFHPITSLLNGAAGDAELLQQVHSLTLDVLNQGGISLVDETYLRSAG